jgi:hypothetical protein
MLSVDQFLESPFVTAPESLDECALARRETGRRGRL